MIRSRNRAGAYTTVSSDVMDDPFLVKAEVNSLVQDLKKKKGWKYLNKEVIMGHNNDDLIMDNVTIVLRADAYKKPRFIK